MTPGTSRDVLRSWIAGRAGRPLPFALRDDTPLLEQRVLSSLDVLELLLLLERLSGKTLDVEALSPGAFRDIDTICHRFLAEAPCP